MRRLSFLVVASMMSSLGGCGDESLSTGAGGVDGALATGGAMGTGGAMSTGGAVSSGGSLSSGAGGTDAALATGGAVGTGGAPFTGSGGADAALAAGREVGADGARSSEVAVGTGGVVSTGGVARMDGALASGGAVGVLDAGDAGMVVDSAGKDAAGGRAGRNILDLVPLDNTVSGWTVDRQRNPNGAAQPMTATTEQEVEMLIDGAAADFFMAPYTPKVFAWQNYVNATLPAAPDGAYLSLYILEMPSVEQATGLYRALLQASLYSRKAGTPDDWQPTTPRVGTESRIQDTGDQWWLNFHQDVFYVEVILDPSSGPAPDYTPSDPDLKQAAITFAQAVASKI